MQIKIDGKVYNIQKAKTVLEACQEVGIEIPTLCHHNDLLPAEGVCRLCLVKVGGKNGRISTSCNLQLEEYMEIITNDQEIDKGRKYNLELLWVDHAGKCAKCVRNGNCELQKLAKKFKIEIEDFVPNVSKFEKNEQLKLLKESLKNRVVDDANPSIYRDNQYCIECRRCIKVCREIQTLDSYGMNYRSIKTKVGTPHETPLDCIFCGQCATYCPTAAITEKDDTEELEKMLSDSSRLKIFQIAPSVRFTLGEEFGYEPGTFVEGKIISALRELGADLVFDTAFSADLTIVEEATELANRILAKLAGKSVVLPMFTSCCPSWVLYVEKYWPQFIPNLSSCKSPQQMLGAMIKTFYAEKRKINKESILSLSVMPCTSKKFEAKRKEMSRDGLPDVDLVVTTRELARLIRRKRIDFRNLKDGLFDRSLGIHSGAGLIFGATGGVMEAALRTAYENLTCEKLEKIEFESVRGLSGIREATIVFPKSQYLKSSINIKVAVAHEIRNAKKILEILEKGDCDYDFVEVMACPGGCLGGGGQPIPTDNQVRKKRMMAIYNQDKGLPIRKSHENQDVIELYENYLGEPGSEKSEEFLHTNYQNRKSDLSEDD